MLPLVLGFLLLVAVQCQVTYIGSKYNSASRSTTFSYSVADDVINHFVLGLESCPEISALSTRPATSNGISLDTQSQVSGISWYGKHQVYSVTLKGHVQKGQTTYAVVLGAYKVNTGVIAGPVCSYYDDVVCNAGGPYYGKCHNHQLSVHLVGHKSVHAVSFSWDHFIPHADLLSPNNVASVLSFSNDACLETYRVSLTVTGHDPTDEVSCYAYIYLEDNTKPIIQNIYERDISAQPHDIPVPMLLTATDECDPNVEIKFSERRVDAGHCSYKLIRTWVAKDHCGNEATHTQVITVIDTEAPTLSGVDDDREYKCDAVPPPCTVEGNDYNDVTVVIKEFKQDGPCDCIYTLTRKWIATDCAGNSHSETQKITVTDDEAPILYGVPSDTNAECDEIPPVPSPSASDNCCGATINFFESKLSGSCVNAYVITRSWIATDSCGLSTEGAQQITVADSEPPIISGVPAGVTVECDEIPPPCEVEAHDSCDDYLSVTFSEDNNLGTCLDTYTITYTWSAEDLCGNIGTQTQVVSIQDFRAPTVTGLPPSELTVECDSLPEFNPRIKDNCDSDPSIDLTTDDLSVTYAHDYVKVFTWVVSDQCGNSNTYSTTLTVEDNEDPVLIGVPDDIYATCESVPDVAEVEATDNCCTDYAIDPVFSEVPTPGSCPSEYVLTRTWTVEDCSHNFNYGTQIVTVQDLQAPVLHGLPGYEVTKCHTPVIDVITITASDNCDLVVEVAESSVTITGSCVGNYKTLNTWTSVDSCGNAVSYTQTIIMYDDQAPVLSDVPFDATVDCYYSGDPSDVTADDLCDHVTIPVVNTVTIQGTCAYDYVVYIQWTVEDDCGNSASASQTVTVQDIEPPTWTSSPDELINLEYPTETPAVELSADDNCDYDPEITFSEKKLQFGYLCPKAYRLVRAWFVIDVCGNLGVPKYQHVVIDDTTNPVFEPPVIADVTVQCDDIRPPFPVHATDAYEDIVVVLQETTEFGSCNQDYDIIRTWIASDSCGNTASIFHIISVEDTTPPILHGVPDDETVECDIPPAALVTAEDNCDGYLDVSLVGDHTTGARYSSGDPTPEGDFDLTSYRTWQVSDNCGNEVTVTQTIQVLDTQKPYFLDYQQHFTAECDNIPPVPTVTSRDECDPNPNRWYEADEESGTCDDSKTIYRTWSVYDHVHHEASFHQTIVVVDTTPPVLAGYASDSIAVECDELPTHHSMTATDNCDKNVEAVWTDTKVDPFYACDDQYIMFWTWTATDACGNSASYTKTINVDDSTPPVLFCGDDRECRDYEGDFEVECEDPFLTTPFTVTAQDKCDVDPTISPQYVTEHGSCNDAYLKIDSWTAVDNCGNSAFYSRSTTVVDTTPPAWTVTPDPTKRVRYDQGIHCPDDLEADDVCDRDVAIKCVSDITNGICEQDYTMTCTCTAVDDCGNSAKFVQVIDVYDDQKPVIDPIDATTVECLSYLVAPSEPHVDWGYGTGKLSFTSRTVPQDCDYHVIYTWTALDDCHLKDVVDQTVVVNDVTPPVIYNVPDDLTTECIPPAPVDYLTGEDNCDGKVLVVADYEKIDIDGPYCYTLVRTWSAVDHCGHVTTDTQTIVVDDNEPPQVSYPPSHLTTDCHSLPFASEDDVSVTDNCEAHRNVTFSDVRVDGTCDCEWQNFRHWHVCDSCGNCVDVYQTVTVIDDLPPSLSLYPGDFTVQSGDVPYAADVVGYDTYGSEVDVTYTERRVNSTYAIGNSYLYLLIRFWTTQDQCQNDESKTQTITVIDTIPVPVDGVPKDVTLPCLDNDDIVANIYSSAYIQLTVENNVIASNGGTLGDIEVTLTVDRREAGTCDSEYLWIRCWQTEDHSFNTDEACFTISYVDNEPPHFLTFPEVEFLECITPDSQLVVEVSAEDNCAAGATVVETSEEFVDNYSGFFTRTWTATDACGHTVTHTQTTWVSDTEPPIWEHLPEDATHCCDDVPPPVTMTANDTCHPNPVVTTMSWKEVICEGEYIIFYSWRAVDVEGNWIRHEQQIQVQDCHDPVLYVGDFGSYSSSSSVAVDAFEWGPGVYECPWVEEHDSLYAKDDCSDYPWNVPVYAVDRWGPDDCKNYIAFHWQTADDCGNEAKFSQTITVEDTTPPVLSGCPSASETLHCGTPLNHPYVSGEDACDPFVEVLRTEDMIQGSCDYDYSVVIRWSIVDRCGLTDGCEQTIVYEDAQDPVLILHAPTLITAECDSPISASAVSASDDCQDYFDIDYKQVQEDGTCPCEYALQRSWTTQDKCGKSASVTQTISVVDTLPPVLSAAPKDTTAPCNHLPPWPPMTATDNCCEVEIKHDSHIIDTDPDCEFSSLHVRWWTAEDECGHLVRYEYTITVVDDEGPVFTLGSFVPGFLKVECDQIPDQDILVAHDECSENVQVTLSHFEHIRDCEDSKFIFRHWVADDDCGNSVSLKQTIQVDDLTPPLIVLPPADSYECDHIPDQNNHNVVATDNCDPNPHVNFQSQLLGADCSDNWSVMMMWIATDRCGNEIIYNLVVAVDDTQFPELIGVPDDITVDCDLPDVPHVTVEDDCDKHLTANFEQEIPYQLCDYSYTAIRRWSATDRCHNSVEGSQRITVVDTGSPEFSSQPSDKTIGCKDPVLPGHVTASDICQNTVVVHVDTLVVPGSCPFQYLTIITWSAEDKCGNSISHSQTVSVHDNAPPELGTPPDYVETSCENIPLPPVLHASDDCSYSLVVLFSESIQAGTCDNSYTITRTWSAVDECGNKVANNQEIDVYDNTPPQLVGIFPIDVSVSCSDIPLIPVFGTSDNCEGYIKYSEDEVTNEGTCKDDYVLVRTFSATDICGNTKIFSYEVTVEDNEEPVFSYMPADLTVECGDVPPQAEVEASDSCYADTLVSTETDGVLSSCPDLGNFLTFYTWQAEDDCGNSDEYTQTITARDTTPPVIQEHEDITCEIGNIPPPWQCQWSDNCDDDNEDSFTATTIAGTCTHQYNIEYKCVATDCSGNQATTTHVIHVFDLTPPVILGVPADTTVEYSKFPGYDASKGVTVADNSDNQLTYVSSLGKVVDVTIPGYDANDYVVIRTFTATDVCKNYVAVHQTITVIDTTPPCFDEEPNDITVECDSIPEPCDIYTVGNEDLHVELFEVENGLENDCDYTISRTWQASDHSGNEATHEQIITVVDTTPPVFTRHPESTTYECDCEGFPALANLAAIDNCDDFVTVHPDEDVTQLSCEDSYILHRSWQAEDSCGNKATWSQQIDIVDTTPPQLSHFESSYTQDCSSPLFSAGPKFTWWDNCDDELDPVKETTSVTWQQKSPCSVTTHNSFELYDDCGNYNHASWSTSVVDDTPPSVFGSKHCVYNKTDNDLYGGSTYMYAEFNIDDLISMEDDCSQPEIIGVFFNRTHDDRTNLLGSPDLIWGPMDMWGSSVRIGNKYEVDVSSNVQYVLVVNAISESDISEPSGHVDVLLLEPDMRPGHEGEWSETAQLVSRLTVSPSAIEASSYSLHFSVEADSFTSVYAASAKIRIILKNIRGVQWQDDAVLKTQHGEGYWKHDIKATDANPKILSCSTEVDPSTLTRPCGSVLVNGQDTYVALPDFSDNRFRYVSTSRDWQSLVSVIDIFDNQQHWWIITNFFGGNPSSYGWLDIDAEIKKRIVVFENMDAILADLKSSNIVSDYWFEQNSRSPEVEIIGANRIQVTCPKKAAVTVTQCQGACYYLGFPNAIHYFNTQKNGFEGGQCRCGASCDVSQPSAWTLGNARSFVIYKWVEGFYYMAEERIVRILALTDQEDGININMWVRVSDRCGNTALGLVEFWVAPSVDDAASQGRTCVLSTASSHSDAAAFTSDDVVTPPGGVKARTAAGAFFEGDGASSTEAEIIEEWKKVFESGELGGIEDNSEILCPAFCNDMYDCITCERCVGIHNSGLSFAMLRSMNGC